MGQLVNEFTWSVSRHKLFCDCQRAYYYNYYCSWGGWEASAPAPVRQYYLLKNLKSLDMWAGSLVHEVIADALRRFARSAAPITAGELQAQARQKLRDGWVEAVSGAWRTQPKKNNLSELYYGNGKNLPPEQTERTKTRVYEALAGFAESAVLQEILAVPYLQWKPVDKLDSFLMDGLKVWCAVDFACTDATGKLRILDWKTGGEREDQLRLQLACYAFYAGERWMTTPDRLQVSGVFLREQARCSQYELTPEVLITARDAIVTSAADMRSRLRNVAGNVAVEADFPPCREPRTCQRCNFRQACPDACLAAT